MAMVMVMVMVLWLNGVHPGQHLTPSLVSPIYFPPLYSFLLPSPLSSFILLPLPILVCGARLVYL